MSSNSDLLHALITELHEGMRARGWRDEDVLDLANVLDARGTVPSDGILGPLTARLRATNGIKVADVRVMASDALTAANKRVVLLERASGRGRAAPKKYPVAAEDLLAIKVSIRDSAAFARLTAGAVVGYLTTHGWRMIAEVRNRDMLPDAPALGGEWRKGKAFLLVPADFVPDRVLRMAEVVASVARLERRSELLVYRDLLAASLRS